MVHLTFCTLASYLAPSWATEAPSLLASSESARRDEILERFPTAEIVASSINTVAPDSGQHYFEVRQKGSAVIGALVPNDFARPIAYAVQDELLVTLKQGADLAQLNAVLGARGSGYSVVEQISRRGVYLLRTVRKGEVDPWTAASTLSGLGIFAVVEPNQMLVLHGNQHGLVVPSEQWSIDTLGLAGDGAVDGDVDGLEALSRLKYGGRPLGDVTVAVIDSGASVDHPALSTQLWTNVNEVAGNGRDDDANGKVDDVHGWNFVGKNANVFDNNGHGTHVAGIIGAKQHKSGVTVGLSPNAKLMVLKVSEQNNMTLDAVVGAIDYAVENGAKVINMSLASRFLSQILEDSVTYAADRDIVTVAAAGNAEPGRLPLDISLPGNAVYPCLSANITLCVFATDRNGSRAAYSNFSSVPKLLAAPGTDIWSSWPGTATGYVHLSGTSMATPHVAAVAAVLRGLYAGMDSNSVQRQLMKTAEAGPRLNFYRAIATPRIPEEDAAASYCNTQVEGTPRKLIAPFASSWEPWFDGSTVERSHRLCTLQQFFAMNSLPGQKLHFALVRDLDWSDIDEPYQAHIGTEAKPFEGAFHGAGHTLKNFLYDRRLNSLGLFAKIGPNGRVSDFRMTNVSLRGYDNVGALAGINEGVIDNVQVEGIVQGAVRVGGVVGVMQKAPDNAKDSGRMSNVFFEGRVIGNAMVGGVAGLATNKATIEGAFAKGFITASAASTTSILSSAGGLVGEISYQAQVNRSLAIAKVEALENAGGLIGAVRCGAQLRTSYSEFVASGKTAGGLVGVIENGVIQEAYSLAIAFGTVSSGGLVGKNRDNSPGGVAGTFACSGNYEKLPGSTLDRTFYLSDHNFPGAGGQAKTLQELRLSSTYANWTLGQGGWDIQAGESPSLSRLVRTRSSDN